MGNICLAPTGTAEPSECELLKRSLHNLVNNRHRWSLNVSHESGDAERRKGWHSSKLEL